MADDEWSVMARHEAAKAIGAWLEGRKRLAIPVHRLTMSDLEGMAEAATARWIVLASERIADAPARSAKIASVLMG